MNINILFYFFVLSVSVFVNADDLPSGTFCGHDVPLKFGYTLHNVRALVRDGTIEVDFEGPTSMHCRGSSNRQKYNLKGTQLALVSDSTHNCINSWLPKHHINIDSLHYDASRKTIHLKISKKISWLYTARRELTFVWKSHNVYSKCSGGNVVA